MKKFEELYRESYPMVYAFLLSLTKDRETAEELTQETFLKAMKGIGKYKGDCKITTWLIQIAKNNYFSHFRKNQKLVKKEYLKRLEIDHDKAPEEYFIEKESMRFLHTVIRNLDEPYQEVVILHLFGELSFKEISKRYNKSESWARVIFYRAKSKIKTVWMEENNE